MNTNKTWGPLVNHRVLVKTSGKPSDERYEYIVREVSPSGGNIRYQNRGGNCFWAPYSEYEVVEDLGVVPVPGKDANHA
jgi:hypothetical protein